MDPYSILGVRPGSSEREVAVAYRERAKRWHPDRGGTPDRMAELNTAYELLRAAGGHTAPPRPADPLRWAVGPELLDALAPDEAVRLVTPASTWASPRVLLTLTERRLLWLLDDAPVARVRSLRFLDVVCVSVRVRRRAATLSLRTSAGRRHSFAELRPHTATAIARTIA